VGFFLNRRSRPYPDVSLYIDQAPLSLPGDGGAYDPSILERVESSRGPREPCSATMRPAAAINFRSGQAERREFAAGGEVGYSRFNTVDVSGFVSGPISDTLERRGWPWKGGKRR